MLDVEILNRKLMFLIPITVVLVSSDFLVMIYRNSKNQPFHAKILFVDDSIGQVKKYPPYLFIFLTFTITLGK